MPITTALSEKARKIVTELGDEFFERRPALELLMIGDLSGENTFLLGPPGTGKSALVRATCERIVGANYWEILLDPQLPPESMFGPIDMKEFEQSGSWHRRVDGYMPTAHKAFLDEVGKAGAAVLNPMLTILNEHLFHNNSKPMQVPLISAAGASNEELVALDPGLAALWDRWMLRVVIEPIQEPSNFAALLQSAVQLPQRPAPTVWSLTELQQARAEVETVALPPGVIDTVLQLKTKLSAEQIRPSDRRWKKAMRVLQGAAWLQGRDTVDDDDLAVLQYVLWDVVEQRKKVEKLVVGSTSPMAKAALDIQEMLEVIAKEIDSRQGQSLQEMAKYGGEAQFKAGELQKKVNDLIEQGKRKGRSTVKLEEVRDQIKNLKMRILTECLNMPADAAARSAGA